ncbi:Phage-related protein%2C tail component [Escherichia coli]|nr:Phage-related protein%2C tail component [Escherichia coli]
MATTNAFCLASPPLVRICLHGDLQRFGRRISLYVNTAAEAIRALSLQVPGFRRQMNEGWYQIRIAGDNMEATGFYRVPLSSAQAGDILLCCFGASVANHAAIYCGNGELLHHLPEQLSKRERYSEKWQRRTHSVWRHRHWHASAFTGIYNDLAAASACM